MKDKFSGPPLPPADDRASRESFKHGRLAAALRENLARRKAQARARKAQAEPACPPGHSSEGSDKPA